MLSKKILVHNKEVYAWASGDLHTHHGVVKEAQLKKNVSRVSSHRGVQFSVFPARLPDQLALFERGPAVILPKDMGLILASTGIGKDSTILEAGAGTGMFTALAAQFVKTVISYELHPVHFQIAKRNIHQLGLTNVRLYPKDVYQGISQKNLDLLVLYLPEPWRVLPHAEKSLKPGAFLVAYLPSLTQVQALVDAAGRFFHVRTTELLQRDWIVEKRRLRPESQMIGHTAFLVFLRKAH